VVNDVSWGALALALTSVGGIYTWWALRHRGFAQAVRAAGITLLPLAAWMTGVLQVFGTVSEAVVHAFARLVFSPFAWLGVIVFVVALTLIGASNVLIRRERPEKSAGVARQRPPVEPKAVAAPTPHDPLIDDELAEIQAILKKRGIS
jgi:hypothetical protein